MGGQWDGMSVGCQWDGMGTGIPVYIHGYGRLQGIVDHNVWSRVPSSKYRTLSSTDGVVQVSNKL
jgi:hypothetical protein